MGGTKTMRAFTLERAMPTLFVIGYAAFVIIQIGAIDVGALIAQAREFVAAMLGRGR
jgi:hypothetical protein